MNPKQPAAIAWVLGERQDGASNGQAEPKDTITLSIIDHATRALVCVQTQFPSTPHNEVADLRLRHYDRNGNEYRLTHYKGRNGTLRRSIEKAATWQHTPCLSWFGGRSDIAARFVYPTGAEIRFKRF